MNMRYDRLPMNAETHGEVFQYYHTRALQMASEQVTWNRTLTWTEAGFLTHFTYQNKQYDSFYVPASKRGQRNGVTMLQHSTNPIITIDDCQVVDFLRNHNKEHVVVKGSYDSLEYKMIEHFYGSQRAKRSRVYLMNHIDEGLFIMKSIGASWQARAAFCLHPMLQADPDLADNFDIVVNKARQIPVALALEYRNIANAYLSPRTIESIDEIALSPLKGVTNMLIADKIQNYKDFILYHKATHAQSAELDLYFNNWLRKLNVVDIFPHWMEALNAVNPPLIG